MLLWPDRKLDGSLAKFLDSARRKRRAEFAYWNQTEASFVSRHTGKSTVRSQPGNEGNGVWQQKDAVPFPQI